MTVTEAPTFAAPGIDPATPAGALDASADRILKSGVLAELKRSTARPNITLAVPDRPGWTVEYSVELNAELLELWAKQATTDGQTNLFELSLLALAGQCRQILRDGEPQVLDGQPLTFTHKALTDLYGSISATATVREFYGNDSMIAATWARIQEAAGAGSLDPTTESSS